MTRLRFPTSLVFSRAYATRRPVRPPQKVLDPLLHSPQAEIQTLPNNLTFIRRPPPSAPSPFSTTLAPASPLLMQPAPPAREPLPPVSRRRREFPDSKVPMKADFEEMHRLRDSDPAHYTRGRLAKMFKCPPFLVALHVPLRAAVHREVVEAREKEDEKNRAQWGEKRALFKAIRRKRRSLW